MVHKYYGIKDRREVKRGVVISTLLLPAGGGRRVLYRSPFPTCSSGRPCPRGGKDYLVPLMLDQAGLPNLLIGVILVLLISASVSTLSSITLTACSTVAMDLVKARLRPKMEDRNTAALTRVLCLAFVVCSATLSPTTPPPSWR